MTSAKATRVLCSAFPPLRNHVDKLFPYISTSTVPAKTTLVREGDVATKLYIIARGSVRTYLVQEDGRERTTQFFFEGRPVACMQSFFTGAPSRWYLETIEETDLFVLEKKDFDRLTADGAGRSMLVAFLKSRLLQYQDMHASYVLDSPETRYVKLIEAQPDITHRVPLYLIAGYLGITPVSLSRIRTRLKKGSDATEG